MNRLKNIGGLLIMLVFLTRCTDKYDYKKVDVSDIKTDVKIVRLEQDLFALNAENFDAQQAILDNKYDGFYSFYLKEILRFGKPKFQGDTAKPSVKEETLLFINDTIMRSVYDETQRIYAKKFPREELEDAIKHFQYYFPKRKINTVITFISGFQYGASTFDDSTLAIGLDMYLGENYAGYQSLEIPSYISKNLKRDFIVPNSMAALYQLYFDRTAYNAELPLIEAMVNEGKKYYFLECMQPNAPDSLIIGYSQKQVQWCKRSEKQIWQYFNEKDLLYKTNFTEQRRYIADAPSTNGMPSESPGKVGAWIGWQIVRKFMREANGSVSLPQLMEKIQPKEIIAKARYKP